MREDLPYRSTQAMPAACLVWSVVGPRIQKDDPLARCLKPSSISSRLLSVSLLSTPYFDARKDYAQRSIHHTLVPRKDPRRIREGHNATPHAALPVELCALRIPFPATDQDHHPQPSPRSAALNSLLQKSRPALTLPQTGETAAQVLSPIAHARWTSNPASSSPPQRSEPIAPAINLDLSPGSTAAVELQTDTQDQCALPLPRSQRRAPAAEPPRERRRSRGSTRARREPHGRAAGGGGC